MRETGNRGSGPWRSLARSWVFPGLDLHTRSRARLRRFWLKGDRDVLDAGSGNGYFSWLAYRSGARVVAMNFEPDQIARAREFFLDFRRAEPSRLAFEQRNLYALASETRRFDEILCYEVLEHLRHDGEVVRQFHRLLRPGGVLHVCCPHRLHPRHQAEVLDLEERGGHVRAGYTAEDYRALLEPAGFRIERFVGLGDAALFQADRLLRTIRNRFGDAVALPLLPLVLPFVWFSRLDPEMPFSLYARALKRGEAE